MELTYHNRPSQNKHNNYIALFLHTAFSEINIYCRPSQNQHTQAGLLGNRHNITVTTGLHKHEYDSLPSVTQVTVVNNNGCPSPCYQTV
jgi:hypothetical protein